jgi:hypothetical protein
LNAALSNKTDEIVDYANRTFVSRLGVLVSLSDLIANQTYAEWRASIDDLSTFLDQNGLVNQSKLIRNPMPV